MNFLSYLLLGTWQGGFAILLVIIGIILFTLPYLVQPVHGYKFRTLFGLILILAGVIGVICATVIGEHEITNAQYQSLADQARTNVTAKQLLKRHIDDNEKITRQDYYTLQKQISRHERREKLKALLNSATDDS